VKTVVKRGRTQKFSEWLCKKSE